MPRDLARMPGCWWVTTPLWFSRSLRPFLYSFSVYSCHLFSTSSASVKFFSISVLYCAHLSMKCSLGISNFLKEISSHSHSVVFLYFFVFFYLLAILWNSAFNEVYLSLSPLPFTSLLFLAICKTSWYSHLAFLQFFFFGMVLVTVSCTMSHTSIHSSSGTLSVRSNPFNLFVTSTV